MQLSLDEWLATAPRLSCDWPPLARIYQRSLVDLAALRFSRGWCPAAHCPRPACPGSWRSSAATACSPASRRCRSRPSWRTTTLRVLAATQGTRDRRLPRRGAGQDPARDPPRRDDGVRRAPALAVLRRRRRDAALPDPARRVRALDRRRAARARPRGRGPGRARLDRRVRRPRRRRLRRVRATQPETGLENQCWKDSWNSIVFADGTMAQLPRATCEIQGYVYDAKIRCARLAREFWDDPALADRLEREAAELKRRFNGDFWLADRGFFALALDGDGRPVDSLTSNIGHLLWSGIVDEEKADACARHLMGDRLFSGWGVRTMAVGEGGYNPIGYHVGTVWPHDNSLIALGLAPLRLSRGGGPDRAGHPGGGRVLLRPPARGVRRLPASADGVSRRVPDRVQPPGLGDRRAAAPAARAAGARAGRRPPAGRPGTAAEPRSARAARHSGPLGPRRRIRPWQARDDMILGRCPRDPAESRRRDAHADRRRDLTARRSCLRVVRRGPAPRRSRSAAGGADTG